MIKLKRAKKGQAMIEATVSFVMVILLLAGITNIWIWGNRQIVERQVRFNATRVEAGTSTDSYELVWGPQVYTPAELTEEDVLRGGPGLGAEGAR